MGKTPALMAWLIASVGALLTLPAAAQEPAAAPQTKIQVNFLNSCRPAPGDLEEMGRALARVKAASAVCGGF